MIAGEPELGFEPVRVHLYERRERLAKESRVNYAKLTYIEYGLEVLFIGSADPGDFDRVSRPAIDICWAKSTRYR